ncbi:MAG: DUF1353 domain-containing protein [Actinomycetes bacterium]
MPFLGGTRVDVSQEKPDDPSWRVLRDIHYEGKDQSFAARVDDRTDFASVPRVLIWLVPRYGRYTAAAILHDHLWAKDVPAGNLTLGQADGIFRRAMRELGVPFLQRWMMWAAVRWGAMVKGAWRHRDWWVDLLRVLPVSLLVLPIVLPPALLIVVALALLLALEGAAWVALRLGKAIGGPLRTVRPDKEVVPPKVSWRL